MGETVAEWGPGMVLLCIPIAPGRPKRQHRRHHHHRWYHTFMEKTTLYLPDDLKAAVKHSAAQQGLSEAEVIRRSIRQVVGAGRPQPRGGLFSSGQPTARRAEELLAGFGER